jgi:hypothetical protein
MASRGATTRRAGHIISMLLGGRVLYAGKSIATTHGHVGTEGLNDVHFDAF